MNDYPILIRGPSRTKLIRFRASSYGEARERAIMKFRNSFVNYKHAKAMDLIEAKVQAAKISLKEKTAVFLYNTGGEIKLVFQEPPNKDDIHGKFVNGTEDKDYLKSLSVSAKETAAKVSQSKSKKKMATSTKAAPAKKAAKKAPKKENGLWHKGLDAKATTLRFTKAQWDKLFALAEKNGGVQKMSHDALVKVFSL